MIAFYKNSDIQKWFEAKNMSKSNSTQNDYLITGAGQAMPETRYTKEYLDKAVADARREVITHLKYVFEEIEPYADRKRMLEYMDNYVKNCLGKDEKTHPI